MSVGGRGDCYLTIAKNKSIRGKIENELFAWNFSLSLVREKVSIMPKFCQPLPVCIVHCHLISFLLCVLTRYQKHFHQVHLVIETGIPCNVLVPILLTAMLKIVGTHFIIFLIQQKKNPFSVTAHSIKFLFCG